MMGYDGGFDGGYMAGYDGENTATQTPPDAGGGGGRGGGRVRRSPSRRRVSVSAPTVHVGARATVVMVEATAEVGAVRARGVLNPTDEEIMVLIIAIDTD